MYVCDYYMINIYVLWEESFKFLLPHLLTLKVHTMSIHIHNSQPKPGRIYRPDLKERWTAATLRAHAWTKISDFNHYAICMYIMYVCDYNLCVIGREFYDNVALPLNLVYMYHVFSPLLFNTHTHN